MTLPPLQTFTIILMVTLGTMITRFLPFIVFSGNKETHPYITYLGKVLPYAVIGLLVVYCFKDTKLTQPSFGLAELIAIIFIILLHNWKNNPLLSIGAGTAVYMLLVQFVFV